MRISGGFLALSALLLSACAGNSIASTERIEAVVTSTTAAPTTVATTAPPTTEPAPTTEAPETSVEEVANPAGASKIAEETTTSTSSTTTTVAPDTTVEVPVLNPPIEPVGSSGGEATKRAQWRLLQLGFWLKDPNGEYDLTTSQAVTAFQKYYGLERDGVLGPATATALSNVAIKPHGRSDSGTLMEVDKGKQVLFVVKDGVTEWVLNVSTGSEKAYDYASKDDPNKRETGDAVTRNGLHKVYRQQADGWWDGDLGKIYRPKYFTGGIAFHGYNNVPPYPASHGCVRLTVPAMDWVWDNDLMPIGTPVWVHEGADAEYDSVVDLNERVAA